MISLTRHLRLLAVMREALYYGTETALYGQGVAVACPRINELAPRLNDHLFLCTQASSSPQLFKINASYTGP